MKTRALLLLPMLLAGLLVLARPAGVRAQEELTVNDVASELYCPQCTGQTVDVCQIQVCADMRELIAERIAAGDSKEEIRALFVARYGQKVTGRPDTRGFHLSAWLAPFALLGVAALTTTLWLRNRPRPTAPAARTPRVPADDPYAARLERELERLERE